MCRANSCARLAKGLLQYFPCCADVTDAGDNVLHAVTHHVYLGMERSSFNSPALLDSPLPEIEWYAATVAALAPAAQIWAGENGVRLESPARGAHK